MPRDSSAFNAATLLCEVQLSSPLPRPPGIPLHRVPPSLPNRSISPSIHTQQLDQLPSTCALQLALYGIHSPKPSTLSAFRVAAFLTASASMQMVDHKLAVSRAGQPKGLTIELQSTCAFYDTVLLQLYSVYLGQTTGISISSLPLLPFSPSNLGHTGEGEDHPIQATLRGEPLGILRVPVAVLVALGKSARPWLPCYTLTLCL